MSSEIKTWSIVDGTTTCRLMFTDKVKRIDIRYKHQNKFTKNGVSLTPSEFKYCLAYANQFDKLPNNVFFYNLKLSKQSGTTFMIQKGDKPSIITSLEFWKIIAPYAVAMIYLISNADLPIEQLLDLSLLSTIMPKKDLLDRKWPESVIDYNPFKSFLHHLGLLKSDQPNIRKIDTESLNRFLIEDSILFDSLVKFLYINRE